MSTLNVFSFSFMSAAINEIKSPNQFLNKLLFSNRVTLPTETVEIGLYQRGREIAPFVRKGGEALMVGGTTSSNAVVETPNIRVKRPMNPRDLMFTRRPGQVVQISSGSQVLSYAEQQMARELQDLADSLANAEEYLCALSLQGTISYSAVDQEVFTVTYPRPAGNSITLSTFWNDATPANVRVITNINTVKKVLAEEGFLPTDAIMGSEAADALRELIQTGNLKMLGGDGSQVAFGTATFVSQFNDDGVIFVGEFSGIRFWEYPRTATLNGVSVNMIRPKYVEFVTNSPAAERTMYFGVIDDMDAIELGSIQTERFAKSWIQKDPSCRVNLVHTKPLPVPRRSGAWVSMKVVSG